LLESGVRSVDELRSLGENVAAFSEELTRANKELKDFLMTNFYRHYRVMRMAGKARRLLSDLFHAYVECPDQLPTSIQAKLRDTDEGLHRVVCDYIAGMTDRYAMTEYKKLFDPEERA